MNWLLIKVALIVAISQIPLETKALEENYESNFIQNESEEIVGNLPEANVILYATQKDGYLKNFNLKTNENVQHFPDWTNVSNEAYSPKIFYKDINSDGNKDLIIVLTTDYGTGIQEQNVHVLHNNRVNGGEIYKEILVDNPIAIVLKNVKTSLTKSEATINIRKEKTVIEIGEFGIQNNQLFPEIYVGNIIEFDVLDNELTAIVGAQIAPVGGEIGSFHIKYIYKDKMYQLKKIEFISNTN